MTDPLARIAAAFVAPAHHPSRPGRRPLEGPPTTVALLGDAPGAIAAARVLARRLRARHHAAAAVIAHWSPNAQPIEPSTADGRSGTCATALPAARALARRLAARELAVRARWHTVGVDLPVDAEHAPLAITRLLAAAGNAPVVSALCGRHEPWMVPLLAAHDAVALQLALSAPVELELLAGEAYDAISQRPPTIVRWGPGALTAACIRAGLLTGPPALREVVP